MAPSSTAVQQRLLRGSDVARMLDISQSQLLRHVAEGKLEAIRLSDRGWHRFRVDDVERLIAGGESDAP